MSDYRLRPGSASWHPFNAASFGQLSRHLRRAKKRPALLLARLTLHTGARINEIRYAEWEDIDLDCRMWKIPPGRAGQPLRSIPLSDSAARVLRALRAQGVDDERVIAGGALARFAELRNATRQFGSSGASFASLRDEALRRMAERLGLLACCLAMGYKPTGYLPAVLLEARKREETRQQFLPSRLSKAAMIFPDTAPFFSSSD